VPDELGPLKSSDSSFNAHLGLKALFGLLQVRVLPEREFPAHDGELRSSDEPPLLHPGIESFGTPARRPTADAAFVAAVVAPRGRRPVPRQVRHREGGDVVVAAGGTVKEKN